MVEQLQRDIFADYKVKDEDEVRDEWIQRARAVARRIAEEVGTVTADDIHRDCPIPPRIERRAMGSVFAGLVKVGNKASERKACHYRMISVFKLPEAAHGTA